MGLYRHNLRLLSSVFEMRKENFGSFDVMEKFTNLKNQFDGSCFGVQPKHVEELLWLGLKNDSFLGVQVAADYY